MRFLNPEESSALGALVERLCPADDEGPGVVELGVIDYIDGHLAGPWDAGAGMYRSGAFLPPHDSWHEVVVEVEGVGRLSNRGRT